MEEAEELSDRVGIINEGRLLAIDSVDALRSTHNLKFKATFRANSGETQTFYGRDSRELSELGGRVPGDNRRKGHSR